MNGFMNFLMDLFFGWLFVGVVDALLKKYIENASVKKDVVKYTKRQLRTIKTEFYVGFFASIALICLPEPHLQSLILGKRILTILFLCFPLLAFLCLLDGIKPVVSSHEESKNYADNKSDDKAD